MTQFFPALLLGCCCAVGLLLIPLGLPGLWVMVLGIIGYGWLTAFHTVGPTTIAVVLAVALLGEVSEYWIGFRFTTRYGGSRRAGWGALVGGIVGAGMGVPVPIVGSVIGALLGSFAGATLLEYWGGWRPDVAVRAGWGAVLGRAAAAALKTALGVVLAVVGIFAVFRPSS
jgi:uncharacterized protein